jgi:hypothetical protein
MAAVRIWLEESGAGGGPGDQVFLSGIDLVMRGATAIFFWALAWRLAESPIAPLLRRVEPYMFLAFCAHLIMIWLAGPLIGRISGPIGSPLYPLFLLVQPLLVLGIVGPGAGVAAGGACWCVSAQRGTAGRAEAGLIYIVMRYRWAA